MKDRSNQNNQKFLWWRNGAQCAGDSMGHPGVQFTLPSGRDKVCLPFVPSCLLKKLHSQETDRTVISGGRAQGSRTIGITGGVLPAHALVTPSTALLQR